MRKKAQRTNKKLRGIEQRNQGQVPKEYRSKEQKCTYAGTRDMT